jgi:hypothetical protein
MNDFASPEEERFEFETVDGLSSLSLANTTCQETSMVAV